MLVGEAAQEQADVNLENTIFAPQRLIGFKFENPWVQWYMRLWPSKIVRGADEKPLIRVQDRGKERLLRPEDIVTMLLVHLRKTAEKFLGMTVMDAVITIPARYGKNQREAMLDACRGARLNILDLIKSPTAAAIAYSLTNRIRMRRNVLVVDMGGSYFDFSLLRVEDGTLIERAIGTDYVDLDSCIVRFCMQELKEKHSANIAGQQLALQRLRRACEMAKRKLSQYSQARIEISGIQEGIDFICSLSRMQFEELCREDVGPLLDPIAFSLEDIGLEKVDVHEVVLVGGSARIPLVRRAIREFFYGKVPREVLRPDHAAVLGAAAYVAILAGGMGSVGIPPELSHIQLHQVMPWATVISEEELGDHLVGKDDVGDGLSDEIVGSTASAEFTEREPIPSDGVVNCPNKTKPTKAFKRIDRPRGPS